MCIAWGASALGTVWGASAAPLLISIDVLRRACRAGKLNFAVALPPENDNIKWRYLLDVQAFEQCLSGDRDLFK